MPKLTPRARAIRLRTKGWLSGVMEAEGLTDSGLAIAILPAERRKTLKLRGARTLIQDAPRKKIAFWRLGMRTPDADSAFDLGEALRRHSVRGVCGASVAFKLGYAVDLARALLSLSVHGDRISALALFVAVPLLERESSEEEPELLEPALELLDAAILNAGASYESSWMARDLTRSRWLPLLESVDNVARQTADLSEGARVAWRLLIEWAILQATELRMDVCAPEEGIELGLLSLTLGRVVDSTFQSFEGRLVNILLNLLRKRKEQNP